MALLSAGMMSVPLNLEAEATERKAEARCADGGVVYVGEDGSEE